MYLNKACEPRIESVRMGQDKAKSAAAASAHWESLHFINITIALYYILILHSGGNVNTAGYLDAFNRNFIVLRTIVRA